MVLIQVDLTEKSSKILDLLKVYKNLDNKSAALNFILESFDVKEYRDDFFENQDNNKKVGV